MNDRSRPKIELRPGVLRAMTEAGRALSYATKRSDVFRVAIQAARGIFPGVDVAVVLVSEEGELGLADHSGNADRFLKEAERHSCATTTDLLVQVNKGQDRFAVPLVARGEELGILLLVELKEDITSAEEWLLSALSDQVALALDSVQLEEAWEEAEELAETKDLLAKRKEKALATVSHDARTPLQTIQWCLDMLEGGEFGSLSEGQRSALRKIRLSARHLGTLMNNVLDMAALSSGRTQLSLQVISVGKLVDDSLTLVKGEVMAKGHTILAEIPDSLEVFADAARMRQVLVNLVGNAAKYTPASGTVTICATDEEGKWVHISVADNGPGISKENLTHIFDAYFREPRRTKRGAGLGLSISRELVARMGGALSVKSEVGKGSTFTVRLPQSAAQSTNSRTN